MGFNYTTRLARRRPGYGYPGGTPGELMRRRQAVNMIQKRVRSWIVTKKREKTKSGIGITTQHDQRRVYTKRNMPRRKKKIWKKFINKVHAVAEKELGSRQVVFNVAAWHQNTTSGNHGVAGYYLYGQQSTTSWASDLHEIAGYENAGTQTAAAGDTTYASTKYLFQSAILDLTIRNASTNNGVSDGRAKLELDVYEMLMREDARTNVTLNSIFDVLADNKTQTSIIGGVTPGPGVQEIEYTLRGVTPFELSYSLSRYGIKIIKKTKYFLPNGDTFTYQVRDPKRRSINKKDIEAEEGFNRPGWTRVIYVVFKLVPGLTIGPIGTAETYQERIETGITRKYFYKIEGVNEDRTLHVTA